AFLDDLARLDEANDPDPAQLALVRKHGAVAGHFDLLTGDLQWPTLAEHGLSGRSDQSAIRFQRKTAVAGVALTTACLYDKESVAFDRDIEWIAGSGDCPLPELCSLVGNRNPTAR